MNVDMKASIESRWPKFTTVEKKIAKYFLDTENSDDYSAKNVAALLHVSEASLSRFAKKCGFSGYREFVFLLSKSSLEPSKADDILGVYKELLDKSGTLLDQSIIKQSAERISQSSRLIIAGKGSCGCTARETAFRLMRLGIDTLAISDDHEMRMAGLFRKTGETVMGFSLSGTTEEVLTLLQESHKQGAWTILITSYADDQYPDYVNDLILVPSLLHLNQGDVISPQFPILVVMDLIYQQLLNTERKKLHRKTLKAIGREKLHD